MSNRPCILAAVDLDGRAGPVIEHAARLAALSRADLLVVHVVDYHAGFESDHVPVQSPARVRQAMIEHTRASLVGLVHLLRLPLGRVEILVEPGRVAETLLALAGALHPSCLLVGRSRWGRLGTTAALARTLHERAGCDLLVAPATEAGRLGNLTAGLRDWLLGEDRPSSGAAGRGGKAHGLGEPPG